MKLPGPALPGRYQLDNLAAALCAFFTMHPAASGNPGPLAAAIPEVRVPGRLQRAFEAPLVLLDVGGDDVGATILATLADDLEGKPLRVLQVINPLRPFTETVEGCLKVRQQIEKASRLSVDGIIGNANLIDETTADDIYNGYDFVNGLCESSGLPLEFITVSRELLSVVDSSRPSANSSEMENSGSHATPPPASA